MNSSSTRHAIGVAAMSGLLATIAILLVPGAVFSAPPVVSHLFPAGGQLGTKVVVTCAGNFTWPLKVWAPGIDVVPAAESGKLEVSIPKDLFADRVWLRLYDAEGTSALLPFLIGSLNEIYETEPNNSPRTAQAIADSPITINGVLQEGDVDAFAVQLTAGQTLVAAVDANTRLGSPMDAILQIASADGVGLADNHDDFQLDPRLAFTAPRAGRYIVRLFAFAAAPDSKVEFHGGANYIYRLTLTTGPFITHTTPLSVPHSDPGTVTVRGWNIPLDLKVPVVPFGGARLADNQEFEVLDDLRRSADDRLGFVFSTEFAGNARVRLSSQDTGPVDPRDPMSLAPSTSVTGCLRTSRQKDVYSVAMKKGQVAMISIESRSLNFVLDPVVQLTDPAGAVVADVDDTGANRDAVISFVANQDGCYRLVVGDRYRQEGERRCYLLTVRLEEPDFELSVTTDTVVVAPDKTAELTVKVQRRSGQSGSIGAISIEAVGLPAGVTAPAVVSEPSGPTAAEVKLTFSVTEGPFSGPIRIVGKSSEPRQIERTGRTPPKLGASLGTVWLTALEKR